LVGGIAKVDLTVFAIGFKEFVDEFAHHICEFARRACIRVFASG
jgi:hypothetical protein